MNNPSDDLPEKKIKTWQIVVIALFALYLLGTLIDNTSKALSSSQSGSSAVSWIPAGYDKWNSNIAYSWVENPTCNTYSVCAAIRVTADIDCPNNLYAELTLQDKNYVQYDYTNNSQGSLFKGDIAELTFNFEPSPRFAHFKVSKISCQ